MTELKGRDFLATTDLTVEEMSALLKLAAVLKAGEIAPICKKVLGLLFYKASTRTRVSFTVAMYQLGGQVIDLNPNLTQVGRGEPISDTARVLDRYLDILAVRTYKQSDLQTFANYAKIPVINALSDLEHPCQILADLLTIQEAFGTLSGLTMTYLGDGNNVAHSLILAGSMMGMHVRVATPKGFEPDAKIVEKAQMIATNGSDVALLNDPVEAVTDAQILYTDVWASMGQEDSAEERVPLFEPFQINGKLLNNADRDAIVLHCLPAHRDEEITDVVMESKQSRIWDQAENRMHAQKALLLSLLGEGLNRKTSGVSRKLREILQNHRIIAAIRAPELTIALAMARAAAAGGIRLIEITWTCDRPQQLIQQLREELPDCSIGCGTILTQEQLESAIACGSQFCFTPHTNIDLIQTAIAANIPIIPGALTPTEIIHASQAGADYVKVFPIQSVGGARYLESLKGPLSHIPLIPSGGIDLENALSLLKAGAVALVLSRALFPKTLVKKQDWLSISQRVSCLLEKLG